MNETKLINGSALSLEHHVAPRRSATVFSPPDGEYTTLPRPKTALGGERRGYRKASGAAASRSGGSASGPSTPKADALAAGAGQQVQRLPEQFSQLPTATSAAAAAAAASLAASASNCFHLMSRACTAASQHGWYGNCAVDRRPVRVSISGTTAPLTS